VAKTFRKLTRLAIRRLQPGESLSEHGITVERIENGDARWTVNVMADGMRIHRVVGMESDGTTRTQAEAYAAQVRTDAKHDRLALPKGRKVALSFRESAKKYLQRLGQEGGKAIDRKKRQLDSHLVPFFGDTPLSKVTGFLVERYKKQRQEQVALPGGTRAWKDDQEKQAKMSKISGATVNRELAVLSHLYRKAAEWGWIPAPPCRIKRFPESSGRIVYLTPEQLAALVEAATHDQSFTIYPFIRIAAATGMRRSEVLRIRKEDVDLGRLVIRIPKAKAGAREQPIPPSLAAYLKGYIEGLPADTPWILPSPTDKEKHIREISDPFRRCAIDAGLDPKQVTPHVLRHTLVSHLIMAGVDLPTVGRISGHKTLVMVQRYAHQNAEHIQAALSKLEKRLHVSV